MYQFSRNGTLRKTGGALALLLATFLFSAATAPANAADPKVQIFSGTDEHWVQFQVARAKGFFKNEGLDAEVTVFTTGATATEAFRAGRGDFISAGDLPSIAMWKTGNVVGLAPLSSDTEIFGIVGKSSISSPGDLRGRKVATRMGSTGEFLLYRYLAAGGLAPSDLHRRSRASRHGAGAGARRYRRICVARAVYEPRDRNRQGHQAHHQRQRSCQ